jgi:hypothetical protein
MADIVLEEENALITQEMTPIKEKKSNLDDFFNSFEETIMKPVIFSRPKEGEDCEHCSA